MKDDENSKPISKEQAVGECTHRMEAGKILRSWDGTPIPGEDEK